MIVSSTVSTLYKVFISILICSIHCFSDDVVDEKVEPMIVDSLDSLMGNFRTQQVFMSSSMLNESRKLGLPKKLAVAEVEEAEERSAKGNTERNDALL